MMTMLRRSAALVGVDIARVRSWRYLPRFASDWASYRRRWSGPRFPLIIRNAHLILIDFGEDAESAAGHYFHQDLWAARKVFEQRPSRHVDVGSRIDGFVAHVLPFMPVTVVDIRPLTSNIEGLAFVQSDVTTLGTFPEASVPSLSCLHAAEHFGLGRYLEPDTDPERFLGATHACGLFEFTKDPAARLRWLSIGPVVETR
jgi:hypothetical protein